MTTRDSDDTVKKIGGKAAKPARQALPDAFGDDDAEAGTVGQGAKETAHPPVTPIDRDALRRAAEGSDLLPMSLGTRHEPTVVYVQMKPAPTEPWQGHFPKYLVQELRAKAGTEGTSQKVLVLRALRDAGYKVDDIDIQDLRRR
ncbi:hypothetical protein GGE65_006245 [Skermanella aerolata]|uniref:hypothetical protein n=1 Tax=Skermanella aerolata TaxID=393310 RepID=UPI003D1AE4DD